MVVGRLQWRVLFGRIVPLLQACSDDQSPSRGKQPLNGGVAPGLVSQRVGLVPATMEHLRAAGMKPVAALALLTQAGAGGIADAKRCPLGQIGDQAGRSGKK